MKLQSVCSRIFLIFIVLNCVIIFPLGVAAGSNSLSNGATYSWKETTYNTSKTIIWNDENQLLNYSLNDPISNYSTTSIIDDGDYYIVKETNYITERNFSVFHNLTFSGNKTINLDLNVYRVDVSYGDGLQLIWMATKDGNLKIETWIDDYNLYYDNYQSTHTIKMINYTRYTDMGQYVDDWNETEEYSTEYHYSSEEYTPLLNNPEIICNNLYEVNFSAPLIITVQIYNTPNGEKVAWADLIYDYVMYNDSNGDGIYTPDISESVDQNPLSIHDFNAEEWRGFYMPSISHSLQTISYINLTDFSRSSNNTFDIQGVNDISIENLSSQINFNAPISTDGNDLSWDITYPDYPLYGVYSNDTYTCTLFPSTRSYEQASRGDYSYGFNYQIGKNQANLDYTIDLPKVSNETTYNIVQGTSLAMPHYTYMISSSEIDQLANNEISLPTDLFEFNMGETAIAEMDMNNPEKNKYLLVDYPTNGENSEFVFKGASVSELITQSTPITYDSLPEVFFPGAEMIFTMDDLISDDPELLDNVKLFSIETQNYPEWSGERLVHDPTLRAYFISNVNPGGFPPLIIGIIIGCFVGIVISVAIPVTYVIEKRNKSEKESVLSLKKGKTLSNQNTGYLEFLLEDEINYEEIDNLHLTITELDFWERVKELKLTPEDEKLFLKDMLSLPPQEREDMLKEMLNLKKSKKKDLFIL